MLSVLSFLFSHWALSAGAVAALAALVASFYVLGPSVVLKRWKWILAALIAGAMFVVGFYEGGSRVSAQWAAEKARTAVAVAKVETKQSDVSAKVEAQTIQSQAAVTQKAAVIIRKVPVYVTVENDAACTINNGFVRMWNAANSGLSLPDAASVTDGQASGVILSDVAAQHDRETEYAKHLEVTIEQWQDWAASEAATSSTK